MTLFLSQGVPVLNMGDEYGATKEGMFDVDSRYLFIAIPSNFLDNLIPPVGVWGAIVVKGLLWESISFSY